MDYGYCSPAVCRSLKKLTFVDNVHGIEQGSMTELFSLEAPFCQLQWGKIVSQNVIIVGLKKNRNYETKKVIIKYRFFPFCPPLAEMGFEDFENYIRSNF